MASKKETQNEAPAVIVKSQYELLDKKTDKPVRVSSLDLYEKLLAKDRYIKLG